MNEEFKGQKLIFKIDGPDIHGCVDLYDLNVSLGELHNILDKSYCILTGQERLSQNDRRKYFIKASGFREGSLLVDLDIVLAGVQLAMPLMGLSNGCSIWEYAKYSFDFLVAVSGLTNKGGTPDIKIQDNGVVNIYNGDVLYQTFPDAKIIDLASRNRVNFAKMSKIIDDKEITSIRIEGSMNEGDSIKMDSSHKTLFNNSTTVFPDLIHLDADIIDFNKETRSGKLRVISSDFMQDDEELPFEIVGDQDINIFIDSMKKPGVKVIALQEVEKDPIKGSIVRKLQIIQLV